MATSGWWQASDGHWYPPEQHPARRSGPGGGWWQASDGHWYPPEQHPDVSHPAAFAQPDGGATRAPAPPSAAAPSTPAPPPMAAPSPAPAAPPPTAPLDRASSPTTPLAPPSGVTGVVPPPPVGATAEPPSTSGSRRGLVLASLVLALLVVGGGATALVLTAAGSPKAALARAVTGVAAPATTTVAFDGSFDYAALPPDEADFIEAELRFMESTLGGWRAEVGMGEDRWVLDLATGELGGGMHLDIATVPAEEAVDAARARGGVPEQVAETAEAMTAMPEEITIALDPGMGMPPPGPAELDGPLAALLSGEPVTVTEAGWVGVALIDAFDLSSEEPEGPFATLGEVMGEYYEAHVTVEEVEGVPQPAGLPAHDRVLEARLPLAEWFDALAEGLGEAPPFAEEYRELREQAAMLGRAEQPPELVVHAWLDGGDLVGARLGLDTLLGAVAEAVAATEGDLAAAEVTTMADVADDLAVVVVLDHGTLTEPRVADAAQSHTAEAFLDDALFAEGALVGADYAALVDALRAEGLLPPILP